MDIKIDSICRLCLKAEGVDFLILDEYRTTKLKVIIPELNINGPGNFVICSKCKEALDASYTLKKTISDNEELIRARKNKLQIFDKVNLDQIFNDGAASHVGTICRVCLNSKDSGNVELESVPPDASFYQVLQTCLSDMNRDLTADPVICETCISKTCDMYDFITASLAVEEKIKEYCESDQETKNLAANKVLAVLTGETAKSSDYTNDFLAEFEVQDEEGTDIFDSIPNPPSYPIEQPTSENNVQWQSDYDIKRKRSSDVPNEGTTPKKSKTNAPKTVEEITEDLPNFKFNFQLIYNTKSGITVADFLSIVDIQKKKYNWSDNIAIQKVLLRLQSIPDLHTWFSSIGDILTWDEWRSKLLQAFPTENDFCINLKRVLNRKKKPTETYVEYCLDKTALLESNNITGENAVSCIVQGLSWHDVLVYCLARIGKYKTTGELLEYFKKCDEKYTVTDISDKTSPAHDPQKERVVTKPPEKGAEPATPDLSLLANRTTVDWKKMKGKCFKCLQTGHLAIECMHAPVNPPAKPVQKPHVPPNQPVANKPPIPNHQIPKQQGMVSPTQPGQKKKRLRPPKCTYCGKFGHKTGVCPHAKLSELRRIQHDNQPKSNKSPSAKCVHCGQTNHASFNCPRPKPRPVNRPPPAKTPNKPGNRGPPGQAQNKQGNRPPQSQNKQGNRPPQAQKEKCLYCNKLGHKTAQCRIGRRQVRRESAVQKCTTCGELGHSHCQRPQVGAGQQQERRGMTEAEKFAAASRNSRAGAPDRRDRQTGDACQFCGSVSHLSSACYYASNTEENYMSNASAPYKQLLCFKCYKIGHQSQDCPRADQWAAHRQ